MARYSIIDLTKSIAHKLQPHASDSQLFLRYATWNKNGNSIIYVYENDIYYRQTPDSETNDVQLTNNGEREAVFNGVPDWVYEGKFILNINF